MVTVSSILWHPEVSLLRCTLSYVADDTDGTDGKPGTIARLWYHKHQALRIYHSTMVESFAVRDEGINSIAAYDLAIVRDGTHALWLHGGIAW